MAQNQIIIQKVKPWVILKNSELVNWYVVIKPHLLCSGWESPLGKKSVDSIQNLSPQLVLKLSLIRLLAVLLMCFTGFTDVAHGYWFHAEMVARMQQLRKLDTRGDQSSMATAVIIPDSRSTQLLCPGHTVVLLKVFGTTYSQWYWRCTPQFLKTLSVLLLSPLISASDLLTGTIHLHWYYASASLLTFIPTGIPTESLQMSNYFGQRLETW